MVRWLRPEYQILGNQAIQAIAEQIKADLSSEEAPQKPSFPGETRDHARALFSVVPSEPTALDDFAVHFHNTRRDTPKGQAEVPSRRELLVEPQHKNSGSKTI